MEDYNINVLFLISEELLPDNGISKKILAQKKAFLTNGLMTKLCYYERINENFYIKVDNEIIFKIGPSSKLTSLKMKCLHQPIFNYIIKNKIDFIYIRYVHNANPFLNYFFSKLIKKGVKIIMEIPTYPYDLESKNVSIFRKIQLYIEKRSRLNFKKYITRIVTFTSDKYIFGIKTINISNGIDFEQINLIENKQKNTNIFNLIAVAHINFWHGYDRIIEGLNDYYKNDKPLSKIIFNIVGKGEENYINSLKEKVKKYNLINNVIFWGNKGNKDLDKLFNNADLAIGCLGCHRKGIENVKALKNVEYAARGIPFIYSEINPDFDNKYYILKVPADDSPINMVKLIDFITSNNFNPILIRKSIKHLSWTAQMTSVCDFIKNNN